MNKNLRVYCLIGVALCVLFPGWTLQDALAQSIDPGVPGPHAVTRDEYDFGNTAFTPPGFPGPVEVIASVHYPTDLSGGPFPLVIFLHGRHVTCFAGSSAFLQWPCTSSRRLIPSYRGYDYIAEILASQGYIVVSISANGINARDSSVSDAGMLARAQLIQHHLDLWNTFNATGGTPFSTLFVGKVNLNKVGTMGHSRGGEGVVRHFIFNRDLGSPYGIKAVLPLAPTDFSRPVINNVPLAVMLPYCDGDVSDLQGVHFFDDVRYNVPGDSAFKHTILVMGANHNFYNTIWTPSIFAPGSSDDWSISSDPHCGSVPGNKRLTEAQQRGTGLAYVTAFIRTFLGSESKFLPILAGDVPPPPSAMTDNVFASVHAPDNPRFRRDINRLLDATNLTGNTLGGAVTQEGLTPYDLCGGEAPQPRQCLPGEFQERQPHTSESFLVPTKRGLSQLRIGWDNTTAEYNNELPEGARNVSSYFALQFRASVNFADSRNPPGTPQDFSLILTDGTGESASILVSDFSKALFYPPGEVGPVPKVILNTVRVPLFVFPLSAVTGLDLTDIRSVQFKFDQKPQGALLISDIAFTNISSAVDVYFLVDLSGSFTDDLPVFQAQAPAIISALKAANPNTRFGLGKFEDYPISPFGSASAGDKAYERLVDLTFDTDAVLNTIAGLFTRSGDDAPQSQLPALFQAATGAGQDFSGAGFPGASIPSGQQANFRIGATKLFLLWTDAPFHRPGDPGTIPYPGPSFSETVAAIRALDPPKVIGISSGTGAISDLREVATATGTFAPPPGVDCDGDGAIDILGGEPLVCGIAPSGEGVGEAITALIEAAATTLKVNIDIKPGSKRNIINLRSTGVVPVAILTTENFDATKVDVRSVRFGPAGATPVRRRVNDLDHDGDPDLLLHFKVRNTGIVCGATFASLTGKTLDGQAIEGTDSIKTVGCKDDGS